MEESIMENGAYGILSLAYMGDAVIETLARRRVITENPNVKPGELVFHTKGYVTCEAQSDAVEKILPVLTEEESDIFRRGRNAKTHFTPHHGDVIQYKRATGFEALMGYLYFCGKDKRIEELFDIAYSKEKV